MNYKYFQCIQFSVLPIDLLKKYSCKIYCNHSSISNFNKNGRIRYLVYPMTFSSAISIIQELEKIKAKYIVVGKCCNTLFLDGKYDGIVVCMENIKGLLLDKEYIYASCGENLQNLVLFAKANALSSLECLYGIPGSVGGATAMNAGAFSGCISDCIEYVDCIYDGMFERINKDDMNFSYRNSICHEKNVVVLGVNFKMEKSNPILIDMKMKEYMKKRRNSQPSYPSLGCVFKKVNGVSAGYYIERAGLKGLRIGGAQISNKHANFIVNTGNATASDFQRLAKLAKAKVDNIFNVSLEYEVLLI